MRPGIRQLKQRLIHQVLQHVLPPDVGDECDLWLKRQNICEILIGADTEVDTAGLELLGQSRNHVLERFFIRNEIIRPEISAGLREFGNQPPELDVGYFLGKTLLHEARARRHINRGECYKRDKPECG